MLRGPGAVAAKLGWQKCVDGRCSPALWFVRCAGLCHCSITCGCRLSRAACQLHSSFAGLAFPLQCPQAACCPVPQR